MVGEKQHNGVLVQSQRTKAKLAENTEASVQAIERLAGALTNKQRDSMETLIWNGLAWTADDVLAQAMQDGYKPTASAETVSGPPSI